MEYSASGKANFALHVVLLLLVYRPGWLRVMLTHVILPFLPSSEPLAPFRS